MAETIVNEDEVLSTFLAEKHEAAIEAFVAADQKVSELAKQIVKARIGAAVPTQTNFGKDRNGARWPAKSTRRRGICRCGSCSGASRT